MTDFGFSGVVSKGTAKETGTLRMKLGEEWVDLGVHFVETIPKGLDLIVGLENQLTAWTWKGEKESLEGIISLFICRRIRRKRTKSRRRLVVIRT
jgi:hypothetical protein